VDEEVLVVGILVTIVVVLFACRVLLLFCNFW
jgi:uncharacterized membrane protein